MELTQAYKHKNYAKATTVSVWTFLRLFVLGTINRNAAVFEALSRATPFGGNWFTAKRSA